MLSIRKTTAINIQKIRSNSEIWKRRAIYESLTQIVEGMVPSQEERGMFLNKKVIIRDYWNTKINLKEKCTLFLIL